MALMGGTLRAAGEGGSHPLLQSPAVTLRSFKEAPTSIGQSPTQHQGV